MRPIDGEALYNKACDLEAKALSHLHEIINDETDIEECMRWSAILAERIAFKHDVLDACTIEPERLKGKWIDKEGGIATCSVCGDRWGVYTVMKYCPNCGAIMK